MTRQYILKDRTPVAVSSIIEWGTWFETADRIVKRTKVGDAEVSTVFLGLDHQWGDGPPLLFETMVFGGERDEDMRRYSTWGEALIGHDEVVAELQSCLNAWLAEVLGPDAKGQ